MLTPELQNDIDEKWNACWPISELKPIVILDLLSYLFFVKKISSEQGTTPSSQEAIKNSKNLPAFIFTGTKGKKEEIKGDYFNDPDDSNIRALFLAGNGCAALGSAYSLHPVYGNYIKGILLMQPTPKLLDTSLGIIKIIKDADNGTKEKIFSYLLNKAKYIDTNGHAYLPVYLADLMVAIARPEKNDVILNPTTGSGNLLVSCATYLAKNSGEELKPNFDSYKLKGFESDGTSLRIGGMNLFLNGISSPEIKVLDIFASLNTIADEDVTVLLANMVFLSGKNDLNSHATSLKDALKKDIHYLNFILKNFKDGARCAVIVPGRILFNTGDEFMDIRKEITDNLTFNALISINDNGNPAFDGAAILVFSKEPSVFTDKVWFYKLEFDGVASNNDKNILWQTEDVVTHFINNGNNEKQGRGFYVDADDIRAKNYNFRYSEHVSVEKEQIPGDNNIKPDNARTKKIRRNKKIIFIAGLIVLLVGLGYLFYFNFFSGKKTINKNKKSVATTVDSAVVNTVKASSLGSIDSMASSKKSNLSKDSADNKGKSYTVISKAYFYSQPDINTRRDLYLNVSNHRTLTSIEEKNGFVYVVYSNSAGKTTSGWLNKNNLEVAEK
ncbi:MAG TPA: N-6 DNA methylase [Hanamia sp.]